jgi:L-threonylcarbamoyladenylate synthase
MITSNNSTITLNTELALDRLKQVDIIAMPTETVYGLAADANCDAAIKRIFTIKKRPINHPLILHIAHNWDLNEWAENIPVYVFALIERFWPGPLTLVLNMRSGSVSPLVTGGQNTVAIRCPNHPVAQDLLMQFGRPLVAPSANLFGKISPTTAEHVYSSFENDNLLILDGGRCSVGIESTIILATEERGHQILRHGVIDEMAIKSVVSTESLNNESNTRVPGQLASHYQPAKPLYFVNDLAQLNEFYHQVNKTTYLLTFSRYQPEENQLHFQLPTNPLDAAHELYYQLRRADQSDSDAIVIELPPDIDAWKAIRERIIKAGRMISIQ